jgi:hypothetical protein
MKQSMLSRRAALAAMGSIPIAAALAAPAERAFADPNAGRPTSGRPAPGRPMAGSLDLSEVEIVDSHMHPLARKLISQAYAGQIAQFASLGVPAGDYPGKSDLMARAREGGTELVMEAPRRTGYFNYVARTYGVAPTLEGFDSITSRYINSDADFSRYITSIFDREKIATVVLRAAEPAPAAPATAIPADRYVWTTVVSELTRLRWIVAQGLTTLPDILAKIDETMEAATERGARGFKNMSAYYRPLALSKPSAADADAALRMLLRSPSAGDTNAPAPTDPDPVFADPKNGLALTTLEDFLFRHIYVKAGRLERPIIIHSAVALHPALRMDFNDPRPLYAVFTDPDIQEARTRFVLIHAGYPTPDVVAAFISQFPNVYTDVSFYSKYPGALLEVYRSLLALGPSNKIMHGSDANTVPEELGYCAWNSRAVLAKVLTEYKESFGWTQADITKMAENILHRTAREFYGIR